MMKVSILLLLSIYLIQCQDLKLIFPQNKDAEKRLEKTLESFIEQKVADQLVDYYPDNYYSQYDSTKYPKQLTLEVECKTRTKNNANNTCHTQVSRIRYENPSWKANNNLKIKADAKKQEISISLKDLTHKGFLCVHYQSPSQENVFTGCNIDYQHSASINIIGQFTTVNKTLEFKFKDYTITSKNTKVCQSSSCKGKVKNQGDSSKQLQRVQSILENQFFKAMYTHFQQQVTKGCLQEIQQRVNTVTTRFNIHDDQKSFQEILLAQLARVYVNTKYSIVETLFNTEVHNYNYTSSKLDPTFNHTNQMINKTIFNLKSNQMAVLLSEKLVNQFAVQEMDRIRGKKATFSTQQVQAFLKDFNVDFNMDSLRQLVQGINSNYSASEQLGLSIEIDYPQNNRSQQLVQLLHDATTNVIFQAKVGVLDSANNVVVEMQGQVFMHGHIYYGQKVFSFKDLSFQLTDVQMLSKGLAFKSRQQEMFQAMLNFAQDYISQKNFIHFIDFDHYTNIVDNQYIKVLVEKTYVDENRLSLILQTQWKKNLLEILKALKK